MSISFTQISYKYYNINHLHFTDCSVIIVSYFFESYYVLNINFDASIFVYIYKILGVTFDTSQLTLTHCGLSSNFFASYFM